MTGKNYADMLSKNKMLNSQIKESEETLTKMLKEKLMEKNHYEQEKNSFQIKLKADQEVCFKQNNLINELTNKNLNIERIKVLIIFNLFYLI